MNLLNLAKTESYRDFDSDGQYVREFVQDSQHDEDMPCFVMRYYTHDELSSQAEIKKYLEEAKKQSGRGVFIFSVTEKEKHFRKWLRAGLSFPGATCTPGRSKMHDDYTCFLVAIPSEEAVSSYARYIRNKA